MGFIDSWKLDTHSIPELSRVAGAQVSAPQPVISLHLVMDLNEVYVGVLARPLVSLINP